MGGRLGGFGGPGGIGFYVGRIECECSIWLELTDVDYLHRARIR